MMPTGVSIRCSPRLQPFEISQRDNQSDRPVTAHSEIADIIEEDHTSCARRINWLAKERTDNNVRSTRLVDDGRPERIMPGAKVFQPLSHRTSTQIRTAVDDYSGWLTTGVRIDYANSSLLCISHGVSFVYNVAWRMSI